MTEQLTYWNGISDVYQQETHISTEDFHFGPLLPGDKELKILPPVASGMRCLEVGCGAAQNSIYLASLGAECTAFDISENQLAAAEKCAHGAGVDIDLKCFGMEDLGKQSLGRFDLIHSSFALCFCDNPEKRIKEMAGLLNSDGFLLISTQHPLFAGEWLEIEGDGMGAFIKNYFVPPKDTRETKAGEKISSRAYPVSLISEWIIESGLQLARILEPCAIDAKSHPQNLKRIPYCSDDWLALTPQLTSIPIASIYLANH